MKLAINLGWDATFIMNEKTLAQLMPILEQCHYVTLNYVEGVGSVYEYREFKPDLRVLSKEQVMEAEEVAALKKAAEENKNDN